MDENFQKERVLKKELKDKILITKLCKQLNMDFFNILGFNPKFEFYGGLDANRFSIYASNGCGIKSKYSIEFKVAIHYLKRLDVLKSDELNSDLTELELCEIADDRRKLSSIDILYVGVRPHGHGVGTLLVSSFLKRVKEMNKFKKIFLMPEDNRAEKFWRSVGFRDMNSDDLMSKVCPIPCYSENMVYDLENNY